MDSLTSLLAAPVEFEHAGQRYRVAQASIVQRARFEAWLCDRAFAVATRMAEDHPDAVRAAVISRVQQDAAAGVYAWGGPACVQALGTRLGGGRMLHLLISDADPTVTEEQALAIWDGLVDERLAAALLERAVSDPPASSAPGAPSAPGPRSSPGSAATSG